MQPWQLSSLRTAREDWDPDEDLPWGEGELLERESGGVVVYPSGESLPIIDVPQRPGDPNYDPNASKMTPTPVVDTSGAHRQKRLSRSFTVDELAQSGGVRFQRARIDPELVRCLQQIRDRVGRPVRINSGYRSWRQNQSLVRRCEKRREEGHSCTVSKKSQHLSGRAVDIRVAGMSGPKLAHAALEACGNRISLGVGWTYIHFDVRPGPPQTWGYGKDRADLKRRGLALRRELAGAAGAPATRPAVAAVEAAPGGGLLGVVGSAVEAVRDALGRGLWTAALAAAIASGQRDVNKLTNLVFFARHPELHGRRIRRGERALAREWLSIRDRLVKPLLARSSPASPGSGRSPVSPSRNVLPFSGELPQKLARLGYDLRPGGSSDPLERALREFQRDNRMRRTGLADAATTAALDALSRQLDTHAGSLPGMRYMSRFRLTRYYVADEASFGSRRVVPVLDPDGNVLAHVDPLFFLHMSVEGTGRISPRDGKPSRLLNVTGKRVDVSHIPAYQAVLDQARRHFKARLTPTRVGATGVKLRDGRVTSVLAFHFVRPSRYGKGYGTLRNIPLDPFRTLAADIGRTPKSDRRFKGKGGLVPPHTRVFVLGLAGTRLPDGTTHDGWCVVNDTGGAIFGAHFDVFTGTRALARQVKLLHVSPVWFAGSEERCPPSYTYGRRR